ncbi:MAG: TonB-dependent receptor [Lysobacteraceae bacterium]
MSRPLRMLLLSLACSAALSAQAQTPPVSIDLPAGDLATALDTLARRSDMQLVYRADQLRGLHTAGVQGAASADEALAKLLSGSGLAARRDASGAVVVVREEAASPPAAAKPEPRAEAETESPTQMPALDVVEVTGSRIARSQVEGPAPISVITSEDIKASGFTSVPDVLTALTQNGGETQGDQSASGADFSPGAQQVDLRALGPNHTLVLVDGRRIADFPLPFKGRSNFTDVSSLPLGMIDRVEVLTGSASAIYGSDAISGVVNFILKREAQGVIADLRYGQTERGDAEEILFDLSGGFSRGGFNLVAGFEYRHQSPLWGYERAQQDSSLDGPTASSQVPPRSFLITDWWDDYIDPGEETCASLSHLNEGTMGYAYRPRYGYYCGSDRTVAYRSMISRREGVNGYASMRYEFGNGIEWFAQMQAGRHELALSRGTRSWALMTPDGVEHDYFYNQHTEQLEYWQRQFTVEEMGGLGNGMVETVQKTFGLTTGITGDFGNAWDYELALSHSQYDASIRWPQIVSSVANDLFLGPLLGYDEDGYPIYDADPARMYTPLSRAEYDAIAAHTTYKPESENQTLSLTLTQFELFELSGRPVGFAATAEVGHQSYDLNPDPLATQYHYYSWKDSDGKGSRNRWALASEVRMPVLETLDLSLAGRYDQYRFAGRDPGRFTWSGGIEWRPLESLLVRGSYGTAFRAPDLHYVFAGPGNDETSGADYYRCATEEAEYPLDECSYSDEGIIRSRSGTPDLAPETSTSWTFGAVFSPLENFDISVDYYEIDMRDQVQDLRVDEVLRNEAACRLGQAGMDSSLCADALARVTRMPDGSLYGVHVNPINVARERTSGIDTSAHYRWETPIGTFGLTGNYTWVREHDIQVYSDEPFVDMFAVNSGYDIPRTKASLRLSWEKSAWSASVHARRLGHLPNDDSYYEVYDAEDSDYGPWVEATWRYNANVQYRFNDQARLSLTVVNLFDAMPPHDPSSTGYPYYDISWFDTEGRSFYLQYTHAFGGGKL